MSDTSISQAPTDADATPPRPDGDGNGHGSAGRPSSTSATTATAGRPPSNGSNGRTAPPAAEPAPSIGVVGFAAVLAVLALIFAAVALVIGKSGDDGSGGGTGAGAATTVELSEFAITPAALTVPAGGSLEVTNAGSTAHNLTIQDTDIATSDLAAGDSETLDLSSLEPGDYEVLCSIPGHAESGMRGTLTVTEGGDSGASLGSAGSSDTTAAQGDSGSASGTSGMAGMDHGGMTEDQYAEMSRAMNETMGQFPAETEGHGNQILRPHVQADGTKVFDLTAEVTSWEVAPGQTVDAWTYNGMVPGPQIRLDGMFGMVTAVVVS